MMPTASTLTPSVPTRNSGSRLWIISDEMSINMLTKPSTHTPAGMEAGPIGLGGFVARGSLIRRSAQHAKLHRRLGVEDVRLLCFEPGE